MTILDTIAAYAKIRVENDRAALPLETLKELEISDDELNERLNSLINKNQEIKKTNEGKIKNRSEEIKMKSQNKWICAAKYLANLMVILIFCSVSKLRSIGTKILIRSRVIWMFSRMMSTGTLASLIRWKALLPM